LFLEVKQMPIFGKPGGFQPQNIAVFRALQLGDLLNAVPALRALRAAFPAAQITFVGLPWARAFVERYHYLLDGFVSFPGFPGLPEQQPDMDVLPGFLRQVQEQHFDLAIQMHGSGGITNHLMTFWGAARYAGFHAAGHYCPDRETFLEYPDHGPERWRHLHLMEFLGIPLKGDQLEFPVRAQDWRELEELREQFGLGGQYVCIHPGARKPERRWPVESFAQVGDGVASLGYQVVITGSREEEPLADAVVRHMTAPAVNLAGKTSLGGLAALLSSTRLLVSNDTGVSHVAAALEVPSVILFSAPDHDRWSPANQQLHRVITGASHVSAPEVLEQVRHHLEETIVQARDIRSPERGAWS
jgi:ADP-heptose:LPS heptosyltransferase